MRSRSPSRSISAHELSRVSQLAGSSSTSLLMSVKLRLPVSIRSLREHAGRAVATDEQVLVSVAVEVGRGAARRLREVDGARERVLPREGSVHALHKDLKALASRANDVKPIVPVQIGHDDPDLRAVP